MSLVKNKLIAFPIEVFQKLEQSARENGRSVTKEIVQIIKESQSDDDDVWN